MGRSAAKATTPKSAPGSNVNRRRASGFTLIELLLVVALIAVASGLATFALRNPSGVQLEQEAGRLAALLESARAQSRGTGIPVRWVPRSATPDAEGFRFEGLVPGNPLPGNWLNPGVSAEIIGVPSLLLGPEPLIGAQRIVLRLDDQRLVLSTDGLGPFEVADGDARTAP
jgi:general secretion pathway protein H